MKIILGYESLLALYFSTISRAVLESSVLASIWILVGLILI